MDKAQGYSSYCKHYVAIDCIIFGFDDNQLQLLLVKRQLQLWKDYWSLMGGFVGNDESLDEAAARVLTELTGLANIYLEQLYTYGDIKRDPGGRVISVSYCALIKTKLYDTELGNKHSAQWFSMDNLPELIFDHREMVDKALRRLRRKSLTQPIGFELLPEKFTLTQLQCLYQAIHHSEFDKRNFRKKILGMDVLTQLEEKDRHSSKKGAYLYRFDKMKYDKLIDRGYIFEL